MVEAGVIQFETHDVRVPENCGTLTLRVNRLLGHKGAVSVAYTTKDQTAIAPKDYLATTGAQTHAFSGQTHTYMHTYVRTYHTHMLYIPYTYAPQACFSGQMATRVSGRWC